MKVITVEIDEQKEELFWQVLHDNNLIEKQFSKKDIEASHIAEILQRREDGALSRTKSWEDIKHKYAR